MDACTLWVGWCLQRSARFLVCDSAWAVALGIRAGGMRAWLDASAVGEGQSHAPAPPHPLAHQSRLGFGKRILKEPQNTSTRQSDGLVPGSVDDVSGGSSRWA